MAARKPAPRQQQASTAAERRMAARATLAEVVDREFETAAIRDAIARHAGDADRRALARALLDALLADDLGMAGDLELPTQFATLAILLCGHAAYFGAIAQAGRTARREEEEAVLMMLAEAGGADFSVPASMTPAPKPLVAELVREACSGEEGAYDAIVTLSAMPAPVRVSMMRGLLRDAARRPELPRLAALLALTPTDPTTAEVLRAWLAKHGGPEAERVLAHLAGRPAASQAPMPWIPLDWPVVEAYASPVDGSGSQALYLVRKRPDGRLAVATAVVNDWRGLADGVGYPRVSRQEADALYAMTARGVSLPPAPAHEVAERLRAGVARAAALGLPPPFMFRVHAALFSGLPSADAPALTPAAPAGKARGGARKGTASKAAAPGDPSDPIFQLKIALKGARPPIWRRVLVPADATLDMLHEVIQAAMGWEGYHMHAFRIGAEEYGPPGPDMGQNDERKARLDRVAEVGTRFAYEYDFGDGWEHVVTVEKRLPREAGQCYPACIKGQGACPPEDSGGLWGYYEKLDALADPDDPEHDEVAEWMGADFDPTAFDLAEADARMPRLARPGVGRRRR